MIILSKYSNERTPMAKKENSFDSHKSTFHDNKLCRGWVELIFFLRFSLCCCCSCCFIRNSRVKIHIANRYDKQN